MATGIPQVRRLNYNGEDIGMGFNSDTGLAVGTALDCDLPVGDRPQEAESEVSIVISHEELMDSIHMSAELEGRYSFASGSAKVDFAKKTDYNSSSTFVLAKLVLSEDVSRGRNFRIKPEAKQFLDGNQLDVFTSAFGDSFVRAHYNGGEFYAVMRLTSVDSKTESQLATSLHLAFQSPTAGADFKGALDTANQSEKTKTDFTVKFYQKSGAGSAEVGTTLSVDDIKARLKSFPDAVKNHPFPYFIEVATYDTVPLPLPSKEQQDDFLLALADADQKKLKYLQLHNDCEFAVEHPEFFYDPPPKAALLTAAETFLQLTNAAIAHAVNLSNGHIVPPQLFDPGRLTPPISPPDIQLRKKDVGLEASFADWWVLRDNPATLNDDRQLVLRIFGEAAPKLQNFNDIRDPGGDPEKTARLQGEALARVAAGFTGMSFKGPVGADGHRLSSVASLPAMLPRSLRQLDVSDNEIARLDGVDQFTLLTSLDASHNRIADLSPLKPLTALRSLMLVDNAIGDLTPIQACATLEELDISGNDVADLSPLLACPKLHDLTIAGTVLFRNGAATKSGNPIENAAALAAHPLLANPFFVGRKLAVRYGTLADGPDRQFTGTATRVADSNRFKVQLTRGAETVEDEWTLRQVRRLTPVSDFSVFFPSVRPDDVPTSGIGLSIFRASAGAKLEITMSHGDPSDPRKCGISPIEYPAFATVIKLPTFDATVIE